MSDKGDGDGDDDYEPFEEEATEADQDEEDSSEEGGGPDVSGETVVPATTLPLSTTSRFMTRFEFARLVGIRAEQISRGEPVHPLVGNVTQEDRAEFLAEMEVNDVRVPLPFFIERPLRGGRVEKINPRDLILPKDRLTFGLEVGDLDPPPEGEPKG